MSMKIESSLAERLKAGYEAYAERDLEIAEEWFPLEEDERQENDEPSSVNPPRLRKRG